MDHRIFRSPFVGWLFRHAKAIPIAPAHEDAELLEQAYDACGRALADGELVCIFPEGKLTRTGDMNPFRHGITEILGGSRRRSCRWRCAGCGAACFRAHDDTRWPRPIQTRRDEPADARGR